MSDTLLGDLELARRAQSRGRYNASDEGELVSVEIDGTLTPRSVDLSGARKKLGLKKADSERLEAAISEAVERAVEKAKRKAEARLEKALGSAREGARH